MFNITSDKTRQKLCALRRQAKKALMTLPQNLDEIKRIREADGKSPAKDYARIFEPETAYFQMLILCKSAYEESYEAKLKLFGPGDMHAIWAVAIGAGLPAPNQARLATDRRYRNKIVNQLKGKDRVSGTDYIQQTAQMASRDRESLEFESKCNLNSTLFAISRNPLWLGVYREGRAGHDCINWRLCKKIGESVRSVLEEWDKPKAEVNDSKN